MNLLLLSLNAGAIAPFLARTTTGGGKKPRIGYITDAQIAYDGAPFVEAERRGIQMQGGDVVFLEARRHTPAQMSAALTSLDVLYVASGSSFALLESLKVTGNDAVIVDHVRTGLPYIGTSAGSIITGPDIAPLALMDDPADGPLLTDSVGLALIDTTIVPHADGKLPHYPPALIERLLRTYGTDHPLLPLRDDQALLVDESGARVILSEPLR